MKKRHILSIILIAAMLIMTLAACGSKSKKFVGTWKQVDESGAEQGTVLILANDGNGSITTDGVSGTVTWSVDGDSLFMTVAICGMSQMTEYSYQFSGDKMTLTSTEGEKVIYRKNK